MTVALKANSSSIKSGQPVKKPDRDTRYALAKGFISLRIISSAMAIVGILAACQMAESPPLLAILGIVGTTVGSYISYRRRHDNNFWIKWCLAAGILLVLGYFLEDILYRVQATIADARVPLTNMLVSLQALHSFDLPRRRDLNVSALVGLTLMASAATLSRDLMFGVYLFVFIGFGTYMLYLDCQSRTFEGTRQLQAGSSSSQSNQIGTAICLIIVPALSMLFFLVMPKLDIKWLGNVRVSVKFNLPFWSDNKVKNPMLQSQRRQDGSLVVNPQAYHGFNEELDLNYRGQLSDQIVLKVACAQDEFWRVMAFDHYDGHRWTMTKPHTTYDRLTTYGAAIPLAPLPSLVTPGRVKTDELSQVFYFEQDQPNLIPAAAVPNLIYFPANKIEADSYGSLRSQVLLEKDLVYTVISQVPRYNLPAMRRQLPLPALLLEHQRHKLANYLQLPVDLPLEIFQLAEHISAGSRTWFGQAERLNLYLQRNYKYNLDIPPTPDNQDALADFLLRNKSGYCEHFAGAFVVLCRCRGLPARLVTGFRPGEYNPFTGLWEVRMRDAHAWAEVFLPQWGWVPFDPTPDGPPPGLTSQQKGLQFDYVFKKLLALTETLGNLSFIKQLIKVSKDVFDPLSLALAKIMVLSTVWLPAAVFMGIVIAGALGIKLSQSARAKASLGPLNSGSSRTKATRQYLELCEMLERLDIKRQPNEAAEELESRVRGRLRAHLISGNELSDLIDRFVTKYANIRFGFDDNIDELQELSSIIQQRVHMI